MERHARTSSSARAPWVPEGKPSSRYDERQCRRERQGRRQGRWGGGECVGGSVVDNNLSMQRPPSATAAPAPSRAWALFLEFLSLSKTHVHAIEVGWSSKNQPRELKEGEQRDRQVKKLALFALFPLSSNERERR